MSATSRTPVHGPTVWRGTDFTGKREISIELGAAELDALKRAAAASAGAVLETLERRHFAAAELEAFMQRVSQEVMHGRGLVIVRGLPVDQHDEETISRMFWGLGVHLGTPVSQSVMGERLGHVLDHSDQDPTARGYRQRYELTPHTDFQDIVTFLCVRQGLEGGKSWFVSGHEIHNQVLKTRPDLLDVLYRGYYTHRFGEQGPGEAPITEHRVPVFAEHGRQVSCRLLRRYIELASHEAKPLSDVEREALEYVDQLSMNPDNGLFLELEPGEAVVMNNYVILHGRTAYEDAPSAQGKRHLMRLWIVPDPPRAVPPNLFVYESEQRGQGIAPRPGHTPSYDDRETVGRVYGNRMPEPGSTVTE